MFANEENYKRCEDAMSKAVQQVNRFTNLRILNPN